jgi:hypothetical protein
MGSSSSLMELSTSREAANCAATQEIPSILWNLKAHYLVHKSPPQVPILSQISLVHTSPSCLSKIHFNIIQSPTSWSPYWFLSFRLSHWYPICIPLLPHSYYMHCPFHPHWLDYSNYTWRRVQVTTFLIMQFSPTSCHFISSYYIFIFFSIPWI